MRRYLPQVRCAGRSNCRACVLRQHMILADIATEELVNFHAVVDDFTFANGATIFETGQPTQAVHCIRAGVVKMVHSDSNGNERIVRVIKKGDLAGLESAFVSHHKHSAVAVGKVLACRIPISDFRNFVAVYPQLQGRLFEKSQAALLEAETWLADFVGGTRPISTRVARLLLHLRDGDSSRIHRFPLYDMAAIIGSSPETVSRTIARFKRQGILRPEGKGEARHHFHGDIAALASIGQ